MEAILKEIYEESLRLKKAIQLIDLMADKFGSPDTIKQLIFKTETNVKIKMYQEHHGEPHVHIDIGKSNHDASIAIRDRRYLAGGINRKYEDKVMEWIERNEANLLIIWNNMQAGQQFDLSILN